MSWAKNQAKWRLGFLLRNMFSVGAISFSYHNRKNSTGNTYSQQNLRAFYAFQPVFTSSYKIAPLWELQLYAGPSFPASFYQRSTEEYFLVGIKMRGTEVEDSPGVFHLGQFAFSLYFQLSL